MLHQRKTLVHPFTRNLTNISFPLALCLMFAATARAQSRLYTEGVKSTFTKMDTFLPYVDTLCDTPGCHQLVAATKNDIEVGRNRLATNTLKGNTRAIWHRQFTVDLLNLEQAMDDIVQRKAGPKDTSLLNQLHQKPTICKVDISCIDMYGVAAGICSAYVAAPIVGAYAAAACILAATHGYMVCIATPSEIDDSGDNGDTGDGSQSGALLWPVWRDSAPVVS